MLFAFVNKNQRSPIVTKNEKKKKKFAANSKQVFNAKWSMVLLTIML